MQKKKKRFHVLPLRNDGLGPPDNKERASWVSVLAETVYSVCMDDKYFIMACLDLSVFHLWIKTSLSKQYRFILQICSIS